MLTPRVPDVATAFGGNWRMPPMHRWIKANFLITTIVAIAVAAPVAASYGSRWLGVLLLSIPFVALGIVVVATVTSLAGMAAIWLIRRRYRGVSRGD